MEQLVNVLIIKGVEGYSVYLNDMRICGNKPWGGGETVREWNVPLSKITNALPREAAHD